MLDAVPDLDTLVVAVGGGGLIAGMAVAARERQARHRSRRRADAALPGHVQRGQGHAPSSQGSSTIAEGIAVGTPGALTRQSSRARSTTCCWSTKATSSRRSLMLLEIEKTLVEGAGRGRAGGADPAPGALPGQASGPGSLRRQHRSAAAGGHHRARHGARRPAGPHARRARATCRARWPSITATVAEAGANIDEVHHQRAFTMLAAQNVEIELVLQTRGREHLASRA